MNNLLCYSIVETLPESLEGFQTKQPRKLADGRYILKWDGECPTELDAEKNRFQTGIFYWFMEKRNWYTHSEILTVLAKEPRKGPPNG